MSSNSETIQSFLIQAITLNNTQDVYRMLASLLGTGEAIPDVVAIFAAKQGDLKLMHMLKDKRVNMKIKTEDGWTILHVAACYGHEQIVSWLLDEKLIDVDVTDRYGRTSLNLAAESGYLEVVKTLVKKVADINHCDKNNHTPLYSAILNGHELIASWLLDEKLIDVDVTDQQGRTPLNLAAESGHLEIVKILLKKDADINHCDNNSYTSLYSAIIKEHKGIKDMLIEQGANMGCLLHLAAYHDQVKIVIDAEKRIKIFIDYTNLLKQTPLHIAAYYGHQEAVQTLLNYGAKINERDEKGFTPLDLAIQKQHKQIEQYLLENGARSGKGVINSISLYLHRHQKILYERAHALALFNAFFLLEFNLVYLSFKGSDDSKLPSATLGILLLATIWLWHTSPVWLQVPQASLDPSILWPVTRMPKS